MKNTKIYGIAHRQPRQIKQFIKFAIVGGSGLIVDYVVLNILRHLLNTSSELAVTGGFVTAALSNFYWNRNWVYPESRKVKKRKQLPAFLAVNFVGLLINISTVYLLEVPLSRLMYSILNSFGFQRGGTFLGLNITKAIAAVIVMIWNFVVNRLVTFRGSTGGNTTNLEIEESVL
jgi:putative flippase GtrA